MEDIPLFYDDIHIYMVGAPHGETMSSDVMAMVAGLNV